MPQPSKQKYGQTTQKTLDRKAGLGINYVAFTQRKDMKTEVFILFPAAVFLMGALFALVSAREQTHLSYYVYAAGALAFGSVALPGVTDTAGFSLSLPVSSVLTLGLRADPLSSFFCLMLSVLGFAVSLYSTGYAKGTANPRSQGALYGLFILSMYAVFYSANIPTFLIAWEVMSLSSYFLVVSDSENEEAGRAGLIYALMTHIGTAFIILSFMLLYSASGSLDFLGVKAGMHATGAFKSAVFVLAFIGFGTKAGMVPLHTWLPRAHPAAPSNVSALMSGVMIKAGIYGMLRVCIDILGAGPTWWGITVLAVGGVSSVLGIMYALMEKDIKRLLAFSSVENVGIILLGLGAAMIFTSSGMPTAAGLALAAALYHTFNHAMFKGLLFLGAGSVLHGTGTKDMERLGGLAGRMPWTSLFFLVGSVSICALPPFNGFIAEWLTYQSLVLGIKTPETVTKVLTLSGGAALAMTGALAAACFVKAYGISFSGAPRSPEAEHAHEASSGMVAGMALLASLCLLIGIFPGYMMGLIGSIPTGGLPYAATVPAAGSFLVVEGGFSSLSSPLVLAFMLGAGIAALLVMRLAGGRAKVTYGDSWGCGIRRLTPRMQYTATAFTKPLRVIFKRIYMPRKDLKIKYALKPFFAREITYHSKMTPFFEHFLYGPAGHGIHQAALKIRRLQSGSLHLYLGYILITLVALLLIWG